MQIRLEPEDEYMHELGPESNFNESMYFNTYDPDTEFGAFVRLGNRANEGKGEMTVCLYLPDGRVAFMYQRPDVTTNDAFDAGGLAFEVIEPFEHLTARYDGQVVVLEDPTQMADPRKAFTENPYEDATIHLDYRRISDVFGGEPDEQLEPTGQEFAKGHYEQLVSATGRICVGGDEWEINGFGLRDHSWGPRFWQAPWYYRWLTANFGDEFGFMGSRIARRDGEGDGIRTGFVWDGDQLHFCDGFEVATEWDDQTYHRRIEATLRSGERSWSIVGEVMNLIPLRSRREGQTTRIGEGLTRWKLEDGRVGFGWSEYLDQIVDGQPVGLAE